MDEETVAGDPDRVNEPPGENGAPSSSFPISSPTFWDEAAKTLVVDDGGIPGEANLNVGNDDVKVRKRSRRVTMDVDTAANPAFSSSPLAKIEDPDDEGGPASKKPRQFSPGTTLSYLPNRLDPMLATDPHSYLTNAEYAPNRFGDIGDYMRKKEIKVQTQNRDIAMSDPSAAHLPQIFRDLSFYINGNTHPPMEEIRKMILQRGGEVRPVLRSKGMVKFIIAPMLTQMKFKQFQNYRVVKEGWILESCKVGKLLDWTRWKLTVQGGWEEEGKKGLEGFFKGTQSQAVKKEEAREAGDEYGSGARSGDEEGGAEQVVETGPAHLASSDPHSVMPKLNPLPPDVQNRRTPSRLDQQSVAEIPISNKSTPMTPKPPRATTKSLIQSPRSAALPSMSNTSRASKPVPQISIKASAVIPPAETKSAATDPNSDRASPQPPRDIHPPEMLTGGDAVESPSKVKKSEGVWEFYHSKESNEDAARMLKNQEWRLKNTAERGNEGGFIDGYYQNSRLHHLSTWKAELRVLVAAAQRQSEQNALSAPSTTAMSPLSLSTSVLPTRAAPTRGSGEKVIFHVDFDCFFVSCGLATRPHLKGKPAVVCHSTGGRMEGSTSEIASASYEARAKGVKNGMSLGRARTLVGEDLQTIPYEFETYKKFSLAFYTVLMGYSDELQAVSVDEALIDVTGAVAARESVPEEAVEESEMAEDMLDGQIKKPRDAAVEIAEKIRDEIRKETGCEVSIGISHNVLLSKLATRRAKPAGVYHLQTAEIPTFLAPLDMEDFPSIGHSISARIEEKFGSAIAGELMEVSKGQFRGLLGPKTGDMVWGYLRGMDERKLEPHKERKSISAEMNYGIRFRNDEQAEICVRDLAAEVAKRMKQVNAKGRLLTLKLLKRHPEAPIEPPKFLGHGWCETFNKSTPIATARGLSTDDPVILGVEAAKLLRAWSLDPTELRGVGIQITKLDGEKPEREAGQGVLNFAGIKPKDAASGDVKMEGGQLSEEDEATDGALDIDVEVDVGYRDVAHVQLAEDPDEVTAKPISPARTVSREPSPSPPVPAAPQDRSRNTSAGPSTKRPLLGPTASSEGIDPDFLAALPEDIRNEVKAEHARTRANARKAATTSIPAPNTSVANAKGGQAGTAGKGKVRMPALKPGAQPAPVPSRLMETRAWSKRPTRDQSKDPVESGSGKPSVVGKHAAAHITKQLRPKNKTHLRAGQIADLALYSAWSKRDHQADEAGSVDSYEIGQSEARLDVGLEGDVQDVPTIRDRIGSESIHGERGKGKEKSLDIALDVVHVDDDDEVVETRDGTIEDTAKIGAYFTRDLETLGIDPTVFAELPAEMQREIFEEEGKKARHRQILHRPADTFRLRARERQADKDRLIRGESRAGSRTTSVSPTRFGNRPGTTRAGSAGLGQAVIPRFSVIRPSTKLPALYKAQSLPDVLETITKWIESRGDKGPAKKDADKVQAYLVRLVRPGQGAGFMGLEAAGECIKWMRVVLEEKFGSSRRGEGRENDAVSLERGGSEKEWWETYDRFKDCVNLWAEEVSSAPLRL